MKPVLDQVRRVADVVATVGLAFPPADLPSQLEQLEALLRAWNAPQGAELAADLRLALGVGDTEQAVRRWAELVVWQSLVQAHADLYEARRALQPAGTAPEEQRPRRTQWVSLVGLERGTQRWIYWGLTDAGEPVRVVDRVTGVDPIDPCGSPVISRLFQARVRPRDLLEHTLLFEDHPVHEGVGVPALAPHFERVPRQVPGHREPKPARSRPLELQPWTPEATVPPELDRCTRWWILAGRTNGMLAVRRTGGGDVGLGAYDGEHWVAAMDQVAMAADVSVWQAWSDELDGDARLWLRVAVAVASAEVDLRNQVAEEVAGWSVTGPWWSARRALAHRWLALLRPEPGPWEEGASWPQRVIGRQGEGPATTEAARVGLQALALPPTEAIALLEANLQALSEPDRVWPDAIELLLWLEQLGQLQPDGDVPARTEQRERAGELAWQALWRWRMEGGDPVALADTLLWLAAVGGGMWMVRRDAAAFG